MAKDLIDNDGRPGPQIAVVRDPRELERYGAYGYPGESYEDDEDAIDLREYWRILMRRKWTVILFALIVIIATVIATFLQTPVYRSELTLKIERESARVVNYEGVTPEEQGGWYGDDFYQTQYELLQSRTLARRVADQLGLEKYQAQRSSNEEPGLLGKLKTSLEGMFGGEESAATATPLDEDEASGGVENIVLGGLSVVPVRNSRLVTLYFDSTDPQLAARVLNTLAEAFIASTLERRFNATTYAKKFLEERIEQVRANLEDSEKRLAEYTAQHGIVDVERLESTLLGKLQGLNEQLVQTEAERFELESEHQQMARQKGVALVRILDDPVIQQLKGRLSELEGEYQENLKVFKPAYPKMRQLQGEIDRVKRKLDEEMAVVRNAVKHSYQAKADEEEKLRAEISGIRQEILTLRDQTTDFKVLQREVHTNRTLYEGLLQRMKEVGVVAGIGTNNISIVDPARVPDYKYKPNLQKNLMLAIVLGLMGGIGLALLFEHLDDTVKSSQDLEKILQKPVLGIVPLVREGADGDEPAMALLSHHDPRSGIAEAFRSLRTALQFSTEDGAPRVLHFTSAGPGEGKTTSATNTAVAYAQTGANVLVIDADLRNPSLHKEFGVSNMLGLTNSLAGDAQPAEITQATAVSNLFVITSGPVSPNPAELLSGGKMVDLVKLAAERFDYVIIDGPPILGLADALVLANLAHSTIMVVEAGVTRRGALEGALKRLRQVQTTLVGGILDKYGKGSSGYGYDYDYSYNYYSYERALPDEEATERLTG